MRKKLNYKRILLLIIIALIVKVSLLSIFGELSLNFSNYFKSYQPSNQTVQVSGLSNQMEKIDSSITIKSQEYDSLVRRNEIVDKIPKTIMPGSYYPFLQEIDQSRIIFAWNKFEGAEEYVLTIYKINHESSRKIKQEIIFEYLTQDTIYVLDKSLFNIGETYKWLVKAKINSKTTAPSRSKYFKLSPLVNENLIKLISPSFDSANEVIVTQSNPKLFWTKAKNATEYFLLLEEITQDSKSKIVFDSREKFKITDTSFTLPPNILLENTSYRLTIHGKGNEGRIYSSPDYFILFKTPQQERLINEVIQQKSEEFEEVILQLQYGNVVQEFINALYKDEKIYLPLMNLLNRLHFSKNYDKEKKILELKPFEDKEQESIIDFEKKTIQIGSDKSQLKLEDYIIFDETIYLLPERIEQIAFIKIDIDLGFLNVTIYSERDLPVIKNYNLERKLLAFQKKNENIIDYPLFERKRHIISGFVLDYYMQTITNKYSPLVSLAELQFGGELLGGDFKFKRSMNFSSNRQEVVNDYSWRYVFDRKFVNQIIVGDVFEEAHQIYFIRGLKISNEPVAPRKTLDTYKYRGKFEPFGIVELYISNSLYAITRADENGNFVFDIPLNFGSSFIEMKYYGKQGSTFSKKDVIQVPYYFLPTKEFNYNITAGKIRYSDNRIFLGEAGYGLTNWLTTKAGFEYLPDTLDKPNLFGSLFARVLTNYLFNVEYFTLGKTRFSLSSLYSSYAGFNLFYSKYKQNIFYNPAHLQDEYGLDFNLPISIKSNMLNIFVSHTRKNYTSSKIHDSRIYIYYNTGFFNPFIGINNQSTNYIGSKNYYGQAYIGASLNLPNLFSSSRFLTGSILNFRFVHNYSEKKVESFNFYFSSNLINPLRIQIWAEKNFLRNYDNYNLQLNLELNQFKYWLSSNVRDNLTQSIQGSISYYPKINQLYFYKQSQIDKSSLIFLMFEDQNGNSIYDKNEKLTKGTDITAEIPYTKSKLSEGIYLVTDLVPYDRYRFKLVETQKSDLLRMSGIEALDIFTEPNQAKLISIPFYSVGEVSGAVYRNVINQIIPLSGVKLKIINNDTGKEIIIQTFSDGSFYYFGLPPAKYSIRILNEQLESLGLISDPEEIHFEISRDENQRYNEGLTFILY